MSERKNIDRLFQEKFKDFEVEPSEIVWKNIESELKKKEDRKVIPFWLKLSGIAATLLIGFFTADSLLDHKKENPVVIQEKNNIENSDFNSVKKNGIVTSTEASDANKNAPSDSSNQIIVPETSNNPDATVDSSDDAVSPSGNSKAEKNFRLTPSDKMKNVNSAVAESKSKSTAISSKKNRLKTILKSDKNNAIVTADVKSTGRKNSRKRILKSKKETVLFADNSTAVKNASNVSSDKKNQNTIDLVSDKNQTQLSTDINTLDNNQPIADSKEIDRKVDTVKVPNALEEILKEKEKKAIVAKEPKKDKWQISSNAAPVYYNSVGNGSPLDSVFKNNPKEYKTNLAYGVGLKYELNPKFSIRTGVSAVALEYNTNDVAFYQSRNAELIKHVSYNAQGSILQIEDKNAVHELSPNEVEINKFDGNLNQKTSYVEVPLELTYKLVDKKFGVEIIGGVSALFLNENKVTLVSPGMEMNIGEANNLNSTHFSTNIGLGLKYNFLKSFQLNFEPMLKYQLNTYTNDSGNFKPYFIGLYTGISYRF